MEGEELLYGLCHLSNIFTEPTDTSVHQVAHALVVDAHNPTDVIVFEMLQVIEIDDLSLTW